MLSNLDLFSLHGLNNLRKLQYAIYGSQLSLTHRQLQTVSFSLISEVNFTFYYALTIYDDTHKTLNDIEHLMIQNFPALLVVTLTWVPPRDKSITWDDCVSRSVKALPKLHQKGLLRPLLPPPSCIK